MKTDFLVHIEPHKTLIFFLLLAEILCNESTKDLIPVFRFENDTTDKTIDETIDERIDETIDETIDDTIDLTAVGIKNDSETYDFNEVS